MAPSYLRATEPLSCISLTKNAPKYLIKPEALCSKSSHKPLVSWDQGDLANTLTQPTTSLTPIFHSTFSLSQIFHLANIFNQPIFSIILYFHSLHNFTWTTFSPRPYFHSAQSHHWLGTRSPDDDKKPFFWKD